MPVIIIACISALTWNFFFIPPLFTFHINQGDDVLMFLMYFIIAMVNGALTYKLRQMEKVQQQREEKENTLRLYNTLLNSLSHELRTPIATIIGATDNLISSNAQESKELSSENKQALLHEKSTASLRLNRQVGNLLNMSRLETGIIKPKLDWCDINELIYSAINNLPASAAAHPISVDLQENLPLFKLDFGLMEQVFSNILINAITYTPEQTSIEIKVFTTGGMDGHFEDEQPKLLRDEPFERLHIIISDHGSGFPEEEISKVFDKFYRLQNSKTGGTGLGLSIVKGFVEAHQGTVSLKNLHQGGARFSIVIPAAFTYLNNLKNE
jgi:two-component system, OmpR family, sensor histidine kinase KdpD